eukprot:Gb_09640 [translate_table: standard]
MALSFPFSPSQSVRSVFCFWLLYFLWRFLSALMAARFGKVGLQGDPMWDIFCFKPWNGVSSEWWGSPESPSLPLKLPGSMAVIGAPSTYGFALGSISAPLHLYLGKFYCCWRLPSSMAVRALFTLFVKMLVSVCFSLAVENHVM